MYVAKFLSNSSYILIISHLLAYYLSSSWNCGCFVCARVVYLSNVLEWKVNTKYKIFRSSLKEFCLPYLSLYTFYWHWHCRGYSSHFLNKPVVHMPLMCNLYVALDYFLLMTHVFNCLLLLLVSLKILKTTSQFTLL